MNNGDLPAMPQNNSETLCRDTGTPHWMHCGLTKREMFAMAAMQGLLVESGRYYSPKDIAHDAIKCADALLVELGKTNV